MVVSGLLQTSSELLQQLRTKAVQVKDVLDEQLRTTADQVDDVRELIDDTTSSEALALLEADEKALLARIDKLEIDLAAVKAAEVPLVITPPPKTGIGLGVVAVVTIVVLGGFLLLR